jgi:hypothetical protein
MSGQIQQSVEQLLKLKRDCLTNVEMQFDDTFLTYAISLFDVLENSDFTALSGTQATKLATKVDAFSKSAQEFNIRAKFKEEQRALKTTMESLRIALDELNVTDSEIPPIETPDIQKIYEKIEQESQTRADNFVSFSNILKDLKEKFEALEPVEQLKTEANEALLLSKEALDKAQKTKTIEFSDKLSKEYEDLQDKYFKTGVAWQIGAIASFISIFCVLFHHQAELPKTIIDTNGSIGNSFVFSVYALNPVFAKIGLIVFFGAMAGVCLRIYSEYKRLSQEYRQKSLLAKNLLTGHEVLKPYIGDRIDTAFILPTIEKMLEDPLTKVYSNKESKEDALGLVEKIMELGKKGKELGSEKAKGD